MKIFIVEDDNFKFSQLAREVDKYRGGTPIARGASLQEAMNGLVADQYDIVLLDMAIPSHAGEAGSADIYSQPVGGLDVLLYLSVQDRPERVIIMTQYPTVEYNREHVPLSKLRETLKADDIFNVDGVILFADDGKWQSQLHDILEPNT
ncbi:response regulator [Gluconobacter kanchanaburiensis]|uniref:Response regulatory domain-containing protein n=1 Tax=Gluconobacter kanchanaburiensis NBRC 103587 TaxID=1307948 RepID=A0A511BB96_9PROT|nr:response regulator [Gluconobacter kanchanaburiensis]MBF0862800.1 response regulator [Gluconobacter kanchanaburiensis]GBR69069.1 response regulator receiver domain-containing protein [Gluconobacter kanchanaburiensis NBRC 103587]GEK97081.1 hypothetical protein GKA01_22780 [Gluconobacter kanchanaburiensis NBRC 103587]